MTDERTRWTDERIDDFSGRLDRFEDRVEARFDGLNRTVIASMAAIMATLIAQILFG